MKVRKFIELENHAVVDFPKLQSPFVRKMVEGHYVVTNEIAEGYEWVFDDPRVCAVDKLHGTNVCVIINNDVVEAVHNRSQSLMDMPLIDMSMKAMAKNALEGIINNQSWIKGRTGRVYGELIGPKINGNLHEVDNYKFVPFDGLKEKCAWHSWHKEEYPKTFEAISEWFREIPSLYSKRHGKDVLAEGLVFHHPDGRMAKLRRDMFSWFFE